MKVPVKCWNRGSRSGLAMNNPGGSSHGSNNAAARNAESDLVPVITICGNIDLQCISCDDPAVKLAHSPPTAPEKPTELERT